MELTKRSMDEMIANFNREVSCMDLSAADKIKILGMITAIGFRYKEDVQFVHAIPTAHPEPCEDAVSRADVVDMLEMFPFIDYDEYATAREHVKRLPSVTPKQRTGKWIKCGWAIKCSECDYDMPFTVRNFCPNCGAKMKGENSESN